MHAPVLEKIFSVFIAFVLFLLICAFGLTFGFYKMMPLYVLFAATAVIVGFLFTNTAFSQIKCTNKGIVFSTSPFLSKSILWKDIAFVETHLVTLLDMFLRRVKPDTMEISSKEKTIEIVISHFRKNDLSTFTLLIEELASNAEIDKSTKSLKL